MTLYVTLNDDGTLALEHDGGGERTVVADDTGGPTEWAAKPSWGVPERAEELLATAIQDAVQRGDIAQAVALVTDGVIEDFVDDR